MRNKCVPGTTVGLMAPYSSQAPTYRCEAIYGEGSTTIAQASRARKLLAARNGGLLYALWAQDEDIVSTFQGNAWSSPIKDGGGIATTAKARQHSSEAQVSFSK